MVNSESLDDLYPYVKYLAERLIEECKKQFINIKITQTFRDIEYQNYLYAQGRTRAGVKITNAKGGNSFHNYKLAFDICINSKADPYNVELLNKVGKIGKSLGLEWGGDFKTISDRPHFQYSEGLTLTEIKKGKLPKKINEVPNKKQEAIKEVIDMAKSWMQEAGENALKNLNDKKLIDSKTWSEKDLENDKVPLWLFFVMIDRLSK